LRIFIVPAHTSCVHATSLEQIINNLPEVPQLSRTEKVLYNKMASTSNQFLFDAMTSRHEKVADGSDSSSSSSKNLTTLVDELSEDIDDFLQWPSQVLVNGVIDAAGRHDWDSRQYAQVEDGDDDNGYDDNNGDDDDEDDPPPNTIDQLFRDHDRGVSIDISFSRHIAKGVPVIERWEDGSYPIHLRLLIEEEIE